MNSSLSWKGIIQNFIFFCTARFLETKWSTLTTLIQICTLYRRNVFKLMPNFYINNNGFVLNPLIRAMVNASRRNRGTNLILAALCRFKYLSFSGVLRVERWNITIPCASPKYKQHVLFLLRRLIYYNLSFVWFNYSFHNSLFCDMERYKY